MNAEIKENSKSILGIGIMKITKNYSENALLINACHVAVDRYKNLTATTGLSTTQNIPPELRLHFEVDAQYTNEDLVSKYSSDVQNIIFGNYIIVSISIVDAILEDLYEFFLRRESPLYTDEMIEQKIRNAWKNNNLVEYLSDTESINLKRPPKNETEFEEAFWRYSELRIIRHSILHTNGEISAKNLKKLQEYADKTPDERKPFCIINSLLFDENRKIVLSVYHVLSIRKYLDNFLMYLYASIDNLAIENDNE